MNEDALRSEIARLLSDNDQLRRRAEDAEEAVLAVVRGEVDALSVGASATPILLHAAQAELRRSERLWRSIFNGALDAILLANDDGCYLDANRAACELFHLTREQLLGRRIAEFTPPGYDLAAGYDALQSRGEMRATWPLTRDDGTSCVVEFSAVANVAPGIHLSVLRDISHGVAAEEELRASYADLERAQAMAHVGSFTSGIGPDDPIRWSRECARIFGVPLGTVLTVKELYELVHPRDRERLRQAERASIDVGAPLDIEHGVLRPDGRPCWVRVRASVEATAGAPPQMRGTVEDLTDRRAAGEALRASEERYRRIVETTSEGVWTYDASGNTTFMNGRMLALVGYTSEEVVGRSVFTLFEEADREEAEARMARRRQGVSERGELMLRRKDGSRVWTSIQSNAIVDADGAFEGAVMMVIDISDVRAAREVRARLAAIVESSADAIVSETVDGVVTSWNRAAEELYQYSASEMLGGSLSRLMPPDLVDEETRTRQRVARGDIVPEYETSRLRKDGSIVELSMRVSPILGGDGSIMGVSKIARDLSARKQAEAALRRTEEQFRQAQKMEAVGRLAGGVAHDFNNLLSVILSYTQLAIARLRPGDPMRKDFEEIHQAGVRATALTQQLLAFSRQQVLQPRVFDLNETLRAMDRMMRRLVGEDIELTWLTAPRLGHVLADPGQIEQVVMNLAVNARDAMPEGGHLTIETTNVTIAADSVGNGGPIPPGDYVMLAVCDTGHGMDAATRSRIFEPFFTTKELGKGTGLGLSIVFGIVQQSGGYVGVYSEPGQGTTFKVYLPRTDRAVDARASRRPSTDVGGTETILLVEDDPQLRNVAVAILRRNGYSVLEAANGGEALLVSKDFPDHIHLLLTDVVMPRMSGRRLAEHLAADRVAMKVLYFSGYTDDAVVHHGVLNAGVHFLHKPFTPAALSSRVRAVLDGDAQGAEAPPLDPRSPEGDGAPLGSEPLPLQLRQTIAQAVTLADYELLEQLISAIPAESRGIAAQLAELMGRFAYDEIQDLVGATSAA